MPGAQSCAVIISQSRMHHLTGARSDAMTSTTMILSMHPYTTAIGGNTVQQPVPVPGALLLTAAFAGRHPCSSVCFAAEHRQPCQALALGTS